MVVRELVPIYPFIGLPSGKVGGLIPRGQEKFLIFDIRVIYCVMDM